MVLGLLKKFIGEKTVKELLGIEEDGIYQFNFEKVHLVVRVKDNHTLLTADWEGDLRLEDFKK